MPSKTAPLQALIKTANEDWIAAGSRSLKECMRRLGTQFKQPLRYTRAAGGSLRFNLDLSDIHMSGLHDIVHCVLLGGSARQATDAAHEFWKDIGCEEGIPFVFCLSDKCHDASLAALPVQRALILPPADFAALLASDKPRMAIKQKLCQQLGRTRLNPYDILRPAERNMFFGRQNELKTLLWDQQSSYAIAGPSRIGKSSLLKRYARELQRRQDPRRDRSFLIDCYDCPDASPDTVACHIAVRLGATWGSSRSANHLTQMLKAQCQSLGGRVELLLDEVDGVCFSRAFDYLAEAARNGYVRLIICGRANLLTMMTKQSSHLAQRLRLLRPEPLDPEAARRLIRGPLGDLGFRFNGEKGVIEHVLHMSGRLPSLLQYYGASIVGFAMERPTDEITLAFVQELENEFETVQHFLDPIFELPDDETIELATVILQDNRTWYEPDEVTALAAKVLRNRKTGRILEICNNLVVQNVLAWEKGSYRIASGALRQFARRFGLLSIPEVS